MVADSPFMDTTQWRVKLGLIEGQVCRVEVNPQSFGTAFLVGPDLIFSKLANTAPGVSTPQLRGSRPVSLPKEIPAFSPIVKSRFFQSARVSYQATPLTSFISI